MKPTRAYILKIDNPISYEYAKTCADSCDAAGLPWEYFTGYTEMSSYQAWCATGLIDPESLDVDVTNMRLKNHPNNASCTSAGHASIWKRIAEGKDEAAVILEHDALMLHPININIPDNQIIALGYKLQRIQDYNHVKAGLPTSVLPCQKHEGAHAYAITKNTAKALLEEIHKKGGPLGIIDNCYFTGAGMKPKGRGTKIPLGIMNPTPAIGWLRKSTIWDKSATHNHTFIESFRKNYTGKIR